MKNILNNLNPSQIEAVQSTEGMLLILAGAGSGKTKTLTARLAYLIKHKGVDPKNTLTLTFTNKAASQMRQKALSLMNLEEEDTPLLCTFHKFGLIFLKYNMAELGRSTNFVIIDTNDQKRMIKDIIKKLKYGINISFALKEISKYKNNMIDPKLAIKNAELIEYKQVAQIYVQYQENIIKNNLVDFDDLLMLSYKILKNNSTLRKNISNRYRYIMVDEYQDTKSLQFYLLELLMSEHKNLCVVGDDDQSIYGWRGANVCNIVDFSTYFKDTKIVKLETNYRSTIPILKAANTLIEHNNHRIEKKLISHRGDGVEVKLQHCIDEVQESRLIAKEIRQIINKGVSANDIAVLYRVNALSRSLEDGFNKEQIHHTVIGSMRFYDRVEIKDIISYLRVILTPDNDFSLLSIINKPKRGLGKISLERLINISFSQNKSLYNYIKSSSDEELSNQISNKSLFKLRKLIIDIDELQEIANNRLYDLIRVFEERFQLKEFYNNLVDSNDKVQNIDEFYGYFKDTILSSIHITLEEFLNNISLSSDQDKKENSSVSIINIHTAKGLEFEYVYLIGLEEGFLPLGEKVDIQEERRLAYVAITRAKTNLTLCYVDSRFYKGQRTALIKSRFLGESGVIKDTSLQINKTSIYKKGDIVKHHIFGMGRVQSVLGKVNKDYNLHINFGGEKRDILSKFVKPI